MGWILFSRSFNVQPSFLYFIFIISSCYHSFFPFFSFIPLAYANLCSIPSSHGRPTRTVSLDSHVHRIQRKSYRSDGLVVHPEVKTEEPGSWQYNRFNTVTVLSVHATQRFVLHDSSFIQRQPIQVLAQARKRLDLYSPSWEVVCPLLANNSTSLCYPRRGIDSRYLNLRCHPPSSITISQLVCGHDLTRHLLPICTSNDRQKLWSIKAYLSTDPEDQEVLEPCEHSGASLKNQSYRQAVLMIIALVIDSLGMTCSGKRRWITESLALCSSSQLRRFVTFTLQARGRSNPFFQRLHFLPPGIPTKELRTLSGHRHFVKPTHSHTTLDKIYKAQRQ